VKQSRLLWLVGAAIALATARTLVPPQAGEALPETAGAFVHASKSVTNVPRPKTSRADAAGADESRADEVDVPGNAFAIRQPPAPPPVPLVKPIQIAAVPIVPLAPVPVQPIAPPMPFQVIGTWEDAHGEGVFLSSPFGTVLARPGALLQAEYLVAAITPQLISLVHIPSKQIVGLPISRPPKTPPAYP
jgi:hypothetical protein